MPVGDGRGREDEEILGGGMLWGGRRWENGAGEGRPRGGEARGKRENRGRGERKMVSKNGNPKI